MKFSKTKMRTGIIAGLILAGIGLLLALTNYCLHAKDADRCYNTVVTAANSFFLIVVAIAILYQQKRKSNVEPGHAADTRLQPSNRQVPVLPTVTITLLGQPKETGLAFYLQCIEALDYPKQRLSIYIQPCNSSETALGTLKNWMLRVRSDYARMEMFDGGNVSEACNEQAMLTQMRKAGLDRAISWDSDFYFTVAADYFIRPPVLRALVKLDLPMVAPFIKHADPRNPYANYHYDVDINGYYRNCEEYGWLHSQRIKGLIEVKLVNGCYLMHRDAVETLAFADDGSGRYEYVIFSDTVRRRRIPQYLDNREIYGYLTLDEDPMLAQTWIGDEINKAFYGPADS